MCDAAGHDGVDAGDLPKFLRRLRIEDAGLSQLDLAEKAIEAIRNAAQTGRIGDGKIFVYTIEQAIRIRTGEFGDEAL